jgi:hypothetical protein
MARFSAWWRHLGSPGRIAVIILAVVIGLGAIGLAIPSGGNEGSKKAPPPGPGDKRIEAPLSVKRIPEYDSSWTFTLEEDGTIEVRTDIHRDDEGREFAVGICSLTRSSGDEDRDVVVFGSDGDYLAHHFRHSFFSSGSCEPDV